MSLRETVRDRMIEVHGAEEGARLALAERMAPIWGITVKSADERLSRWFSGRRDMTTEPLEQMLNVLGLGVSALDLAASNCEPDAEPVGHLDSALEQAP